MAYAITPRGVGQPVSARRIEAGWPLAAGETFTVEVYSPGLVLAEDEQSLREAQPADRLDRVKREAKAAVDDRAEAARRQYLTPGDGQALEYRQTQREALDAVAVLDGGGAIAAADYPMIEAERAARADAGLTQDDGSAWTIEAVAQEIAAQEIAAWIAAGAEIKRTRRAAKLQIDQAADEAGVQAILDGLTWPTPGG